MHDTGVLRSSEAAHLLCVCRVMLTVVSACATGTGCERGRGHGEGKNGSKCERYDSAHCYSSQTFPDGIGNHYYFRKD